MTAFVIENCGNCRYRDHKEGECRRYPPVPAPMPQPRALGGMDLMILAMRPPVPETQWCGDWAPGAEA